MTSWTLAAFLLIFTPADSRAQEAPVGAVLDSATAQVAPSQGAEVPAAGFSNPAGLGAAQPMAGLPQRIPEPRTLQEFWPVFAGFALTWVGITGYMLTFGARSRRVTEAMTRADASTSKPGL